MTRVALLSFLPELVLVPAVSAASGLDLVVSADPLGRWASVSIPGCGSLRVAATTGGVEHTIEAPSVSGSPADARRHSAAIDALVRVTDLLDLAAQLPLGAVRAVSALSERDLDEGDAVEAYVDVAEQHDSEERVETLVDLGLALRELRLEAEAILARDVARHAEAEIAGALL